MDHRLRSGVKFIPSVRLAAVSALLAAGLWLVPSVALADPAIVLSPDKGPFGTSLTVSGGGFEAHSIATVHWGDSILTDFSTNGSGDFSVGIVVPEVNNGAHDVVVRSAGGTASARFVVQGSEPPSTTTTTEPTTTSSTTAPTTTTPTTTAPSPTTTAPSPTTTTPTTTTRPTTTTTPTTTSPTTTTPSPTTPSPTTSEPDPTTTSPTSTTSPTQTTSEREGARPTNRDRRDPATSTTRSATDDGDTRPADPSTDTSLEEAASDPADESTTTTTVTEVMGQMTLPFPSLRAWGVGDVPPELTGGRMAVGEFSLSPAEGFPGSTLELSFRFDRAIPGLTAVRVTMNDRALGDEIPVEDLSFSVRRTVPDLPPDTYEVAVLSGDLVLTTAEFTVLEPAESASASGSTPVVVLGVLALVAGLGWRATRNFQGYLASSGALGPVDTWYAWREKHRR